MPDTPLLARPPPNPAPSSSSSAAINPFLSAQHPQLPVVCNYTPAAQATMQAGMTALPPCLLAAAQRLAPPPAGSAPRRTAAAVTSCSTSRTSCWASCCRCWGRSAGVQPRLRRPCLTSCWACTLPMPSWGSGYQSGAWPCLLTQAHNAACNTAAAAPAQGMLMV